MEEGIGNEQWLQQKWQGEADAHDVVGGRREALVQLKSDDDGEAADPNGGVVQRVHLVRVFGRLGLGIGNVGRLYLEGAVGGLDEDKPSQNCQHRAKDCSHLHGRFIVRKEGRERPHLIGGRHGGMDRWIEK